MAHPDDPHLPDPAAPVALYEGPRLRLFRGWTLVGLVLVCVSAGALGREAFLHLPKPAATPTARPVLLSAAGPVIQATMPTPDDATITLPAAQPVLVNVWLQNCADCKPAFDAWSALVEQQRLPRDITVYNVAYGSADPSWAAAHHLDSNLAIDSGVGVVQPLGIHTFTTLVVDRHGRVRLRDRPDSPGFADRVTGALQTLWSDPDARAPEQEPKGCLD